MQKSLLFCCLFLLFHFGSNAQDSLITRALDSITIKASRISEKLTEVPFAISSLGKSQLQLGQPQLTINDALDQIPGVFALNATNFAQDLRVSIRGFGARSSFGIRGIQIIVDGLPETTPDGQGQVDNLDIGLLERLEVLRGPSSSLYGNAAGGVLNFVTQETSSQLMTQFRAAIGSFGLQQYQLKFGQTLGKLNYIVHGNYMQMDGFRQQSAVQMGQFYAKANYQLNANSSIRFILNYSNSPKAEDPGSLTLEQVSESREQARDRNVLFNGGEEITQTRLGLIFNQKINKGNLTIKAFTTFRDFSNRLPFENGGIVQFERQFHGGGVKYTTPTTYGNIHGQFVVGSDISIQSDDRRRYNNLEGVLGDLSFEQEERFQSIGLYAIQHLLLGEKWRARVAFRADFLNLEAIDRFTANGDNSGDRTYNQVNPSIALQYLISNTSQIFTSFSTSFETPALSELSNNPTNLGGFNNELGPQKATNYEVGYRSEFTNRLFGEVALFYIQVEDEILPFELEPFPGRTFFRNAGSTNRTGIEMQLNYAFAKHWLARASYTYSDFKFNDFDRFDGNRLPGIPQHMGFVALRYQKLKGFYGSIQTRFVGELFVNNSNEVTDDAYTIVNLRLGYRFRKVGWNFSPFFGVNNLLDTAYNANIRINAFGNRFFEPGPGVHFYGGIKFGFTN
ncbi:MAG: TonB-dependent receptor [Saprospiraceae bacterium]|nr:TonB-dependent receptor [Saprospiraceae bacterium]